MIKDFLQQLNSADVGAILLLIWAVVRLVLAFFEFKQTRDTVKLKKEVNTVMDELKKVDEPKTVKAKRKFQKVYSPLIKEYKLDEKTGELVDIGVIDVDEKIQSYVDTCFERILEKYLPTGEIERFIPALADDQFGEAKGLQDPWEDLAEAKDYFLEMREKYGFDEEMTDVDVYNALVKKANGLDEEIKKKAAKQTPEKATEEVKDENQIDVDEAIAFWKANHKEA